MVNKKYLDMDREGQFVSPSALSPSPGLHQPLFNHDYADADILHLSAFFRNNPNPILIFSPDGTIIKVNPAAIRMLKRLQIQETDLLPDNHRQIIDACLKGELKECAVEVTVSDRVFALTYHSLSSFKMVYLYAIEITEYRRAENDLLRIVNNTLALAKQAVSNLQTFRKQLPESDKQRQDQDPFADLFVAMDGCVFSATNKPIEPDRE